MLPPRLQHPRKPRPALQGRACRFRPLLPSRVPLGSAHQIDFNSFPISPLPRRRLLQGEASCQEGAACMCWGRSGWDCGQSRDPASAHQPGCCRLQGGGCLLQNGRILSPRARCRTEGRKAPSPLSAGLGQIIPHCMNMPHFVSPRPLALSAHCGCCE